MVYDLFTLLPIEQNYNIYRHKAAVIVKFIQKYSYMLNTEYQSVIYIDYKPFVKFLNVDYYKDIFAHWVKKLFLLNICIQYILRKKNIIEDDLSLIIFNNANCFSDWLVNKLAKEISSY